MNLAVKYRPQNWDDVIGHSNVLDSIHKKFKDTEHPHCIMFTGPSGTGKTTMARLLAKTVQCEGSNLQEINASNNRGIETARDIIKNMVYAPTIGKSKVYFMDECHHLTTQGQEALLKVLEDACPDHVYFIFATSEPEKLKLSFKRRFVQFELKPVSEINITKLLNQVMVDQGFSNDEPKIIDIAEASEGSPGIALAILDRVIDLPTNEWTEAIQDGTTPQEIIDLCRALNQKKSWVSIVEILKELKLEPESARRVVLGYYSKCLMNPRNDHEGHQFYHVMSCFADNYFNTGKPGLIMSCWEASHPE